MWMLLRNTTDAICSHACLCRPHTPIHCPSLIAWMSHYFLVCLLIVINTRFHMCALLMFGEGNYSALLCCTCNIYFMQSFDHHPSQYYTLFVCMSRCVYWFMYHNQKTVYFCPAAFWKSMSGQLYSEITDTIIFSWAILWNTVPLCLLSSTHSFCMQRTPWSNSATIILHTYWFKMNGHD